MIGLVLQLFHNRIISAFLDAETSNEAFATGNAYLQFIAFFFVFIGFKACTDGVLRGAGDVGMYLVANLCNLFIRVVVSAHPYGAYRWSGMRCQLAGWSII